MNTGLAAYFFGNGLDQKLTFQRFLTFQRQLQREILGIEVAGLLELYFLYFSVFCGTEELMTYLSIVTACIIRLHDMQTIAIDDHGVCHLIKFLETFAPRSESSAE